MSSPKGKTVALVDPLWIGHHPMYFTQFTAAFLRLGARVIGLCPQPGTARHDLRQALGGEIPAGAVHFHRLELGKRSFFNGRFEGDPVRTFARWRAASDALADAEGESGLTADLVYFPYLDSYLRFLPVPVVPQLLMNRPWSGLYLRNHHHGTPPSVKSGLRLLAKGDALLRSRLCLGIGVLDERFIPAMERFARCGVTAYPDVTQAGLPERPFPPAEEICRKAAGRTIVGMIGLERRKGFLTLLRTARLAAARGLPLYFACAGVICLAQYSQQEQAEIRALIDGIASGQIVNFHFDPAAGRIAEEADYNALFATFDIAWAAYEGFQGSSGTLGKVALFETPCVATAGECVGRRVEHYGLGLTIAEGSAEEAFAAISRLAGGDGPRAPRFADYRRDHSQERLDGILRELLEAV